VGEPLVPPRTPSLRAAAAVPSAAEPAVVELIPILPRRWVPSAGRSPAPAPNRPGSRAA